MEGHDGVTSESSRIVKHVVARFSTLQKESVAPLIRKVALANTLRLILVVAG